tara:strand:+ start:1365 stop:2096 length:732 start_codon:yes stop_codon:yes gene_type:complete
MVNMTDDNTPDGNTGAGPTVILPARKIGLMARLRNYFFTGLVVAAPIGLTVYITSWFVELVDTWFVPLIPAPFRPTAVMPFDIPGLGLIIAVLLLTLLGAFTANFFGRAILTFAERLVDRMPVVRSIYGAIKQIFETVISQSTTSFREVGLIEYPRNGIYTIVFVTSQTTARVGGPYGLDLISVFLPTTPNPTSGFLLYVPREDVRILDMTIEEGAKLIISAGLVEPKKLPVKTPVVSPSAGS